MGDGSREVLDALVRQAREGDDRAFRSLIEIHQGAVFGLARRKLGGDSQRAEEVAQEAFVRLHGALPNIRVGAAVGMWLHRVTLNLCRDAMRRDRRERRVIPLSSVAESSLASPYAASTSGSPFDDAASADQVERLERALAALPEGLSAVVRMRFEAGLSYDEIAQAMNLPVGTVCSRLYRALRKLAAYLREPHGYRSAQS